MNTSSSRALIKSGSLQDVGWTSLSIATALVLLPALGLKALKQAAFPKKPQAAGAEERHYLIN